MSFATLIVNFGGPRSLAEVEPFLKTLLNDRDVVRTRLPALAHRFLFTRIAKKRAKKVSEDYASIGGKSPIFEDTEAVAEALRADLPGPVLTFHRYLPATHAAFFKALSALSQSEIRVFPMFPQFTYATTGSIARLFARKLDKPTLHKLRWVKSYPAHPAYIRLFQDSILDFLKEQDLPHDKTLLLFSAHGIPKKFMATGDLYEDECRLSFKKIMEGLPSLAGKLCYQSKFGPGEWLRPYTSAVCAQPFDRENVVVVPLSFTSDHIETLFEIEQEYLPEIRKQGAKAYRLPAFNRSPLWIQAIAQILQEQTPVHTTMLMRCCKNG